MAKPPKWGFGGSPASIVPIGIRGEPPSARDLHKLRRQIARMLARPRGASGERGQAALVYYDAARAAGRQHSTRLLDEATKAAGLTTRRTLQGLLKKRNNS